MQKYRAKLQRYTIILTIITLIVSGIFIVCALNNVSKILLLTLFLLLFFTLSSLISVIFMLYLPRLEKLLAKRRKQKRPLTKSDRNASTLYTPEIKAAKVITLRSWADSLSSRDQTSPNKTSSFTWANLGAKFPRLSRPAVCFSTIRSS